MISAVNKFQDREKALKAVAQKLKITLKQLTNYLDKTYDKRGEADG